MENESMPKGDDDNGACEAFLTTHGDIIGNALRTMMTLGAPLEQMVLVCLDVTGNASLDPIARLLAPMQGPEERTGSTIVIAPMMTSVALDIFRQASPLLHVGLRTPVHPTQVKLLLILNEGIAVVTENTERFLPKGG